MAVIGPIPLSGGWVSDADAWNPPPNGGGLTYQLLKPSGNGAATFDIVLAIGNQLPTHSQVSGLFYWQDPAQLSVGNTDILISTVGSKIYTSPPPSSISWTDRTGSTTVQSQNYYTFDVLNAIVILANGGNQGTTAPLKITAYNTNAAALAGSPPNCNIVRVVNNFAFMAQNLSATGLMSRVYWSNVGDPETWSASNFVDVRKSDGETMTALSSIGTDLIIFKLNSISRLTANPISGTSVIGPLTQITDRIGCMGPMAIDTLPDGTIVFVGSDSHIYRFDGVAFQDLSHLPYPQSNISTPIATTFNAPLYECQLKVDPRFHRLFVTYAGSGNDTRLYCFDYVRSVWMDATILQTTTENCNYLAQIPSGRNVFAFGAINKSITFGSNLGNIFQLNGVSQVLDFNQGFPSCIFETSVLLQSGPQRFIPRSILIPLRQPNSNAGQVSVTIGYDGTYKSSVEYSGSIPASGTILVKIGDALPVTYVRSTTMQIKITLFGNQSLSPTVIEPFYVSDEVLS